MFVNQLRRNKQSLKRTFHRRFLPSFSLFGCTVSEKKIFQKSNNQKQELSVATMFDNGSGRNEQNLQRTCHRCILPSFGSFGKAVSEEKIFQKSTNQKQELSVVAMFVNGLELNEQCLYRTFQRCFQPSYGLFGPTVLEKKNFKNQSFRNKICLWRPCLITDRDEMSNFYRGLSIDASY